MMRIAIDASTWDNRRGFGRFTREIVAAMLRLGSPHRFVLFFDGAVPHGMDAAECIAVRQSRSVTESAVADDSRNPFDLLRFTAAVGRARPDVLFYPAVYSWFPCPPRVRNLLTLHDAIAEHLPDMVFPKRRFRTMWQLKVRLARLQATRFLTVSNAARTEIGIYMGIDPARIDLTTEGAKAVFRPLPRDEDRALARQSIRLRLALPAEARYFSFVGGFAPHKNLLGLVRSFARLVGSGRPDVHLLLVGDIGSSGFHSNVTQIEECLAAEPALAGRVHFTGFLDDELLANIYATSIAVVLPSFSEGFGLPIVEAMACATPVLAANVGSMPEVLGDAGLLFDPHDLDAMTECLRKVHDDPTLAADLRERALRRSARFSWERAARLALESIERCAKRGVR
jgi:glycosyltransferase involved in cell wall biosynthesis